MNPLIAVDSVGPHQLDGIALCKGMGDDPVVRILDKGVNHVANLTDQISEHEIVLGQKRIHGAGCEALDQGGPAQLVFRHQSRRGHLGHDRQKDRCHAKHDGDNAQIELCLEFESGKKELH
jgi:hypothetical protein